MDKEDIQPCQGCSTACLGCVTLSPVLIFPGMRSKSDIIAEMAEQKMVEAMVENIAHQSLNSDLKDLSQMIYLILLEYDDDKIQDLWEHKQMTYFIAKIIINQYRSSNSPFHSLFRKFRGMINENALLDLRGCDISDENVRSTFKIIRYEPGE